MPVKPQTQSQPQPQNDIQIKYGLVLVKSSEKYSTYQVVYRKEFDLKEMVRELREFAIVNRAVVRIINVYAVDSIHSVSLTILPSGILRLSIMMGFRTGVAVPNAVDILPEELSTLKTLVEKAIEITQNMF